MTNIFEPLKDFLQISFDNETKNPLHVGEVKGCWMYLALMDEATIYIQIGMNSTSNDVVKKLLVDSLKQCETQGQRFKEFLRAEGVHLPPTSEERPYSNPNGVPQGGKLKIMNGLSIKTVAAITHCAASAS